MFLAWLHPQTTESTAWVEMEVADVLAAGWRLAAAGDGVRIAVCGERPPCVRAFGDGFVVGEVFHAHAPMSDAPDTLPGGRTPPELGANVLLRRFWGRYVALLRAPQGRSWSVLRDPSGAMEALTWEAHGVWRLASALTLPPGLGPDVRIDWERVGGLLADPLRISGELALRGVTALAPGELRPLRAGVDTGDLAWSPTRWAAEGEMDPARARERIRDVVTAMTRGLARPLCEVSGGFDSSLVAALVSEVRGADRVCWVHHVVEEAEADERRFARATACRLGLDLRERIKAEAPLDPSGLKRLDRLARPSLNATDIEYEDAMIAVARARGADGLVTGQGGDAVFLTLRSPWLGADLMRRRGAKALLDGELADMARFARCSVWSLLGRALAFGLGGGRHGFPTPNVYASREARREARRGRPHPWLEGAAALSPGKRLQIEGLAGALAVQGECARSRALPLMHPLLAQPVLELCLPVAADILVHRGRDRAWAREVFAQDLAPEVLDRRTKGDMTAYYGRMVAAGLPQLLPFLLNGQLSAHGLIARDRLAGALTVEALAVDGRYADIMDLVAVEAWARSWET